MPKEAENGWVGRVVVVVVVVVAGAWVVTGGWVTALVVDVVSLLLLLNTMCGTRPSAHCAPKSVSSSRTARDGSTWTNPMAMNALSQLHWYG